MKVKIQIKSLAGSILFEYEKEDNTIKDTLVKAVESKAYLRGAYLGGADLRDADLRDADLRDADLRGADLRGAYLGGANLGGAKEIPPIAIAQSRILPEGDLIGYKQCLDGIIVKLLIPKEARRSSAFGRKCRAEFAQVLEIHGATEAISQWETSTKFFYRVGETVRPSKPFDENWMEECSTGIHFYITRLEAELN